MFKYDYIQAKLHGIYAKSMVRENLEQLKKARSLENAYPLLFPAQKLAPDEQLAYSRVERRFKEKIFKQINFVAHYFAFKNNFLNSLIQKEEVENVKLLLKHYFEPHNRRPNFFPIEMVNTLDYRKIDQANLANFKEIQDILQDTVFSFVLPLVEKKQDVLFIENRLDQFYYECQLNALNELTPYERKRLQKLIWQEMNWQNICWAFRLKVYYHKSFSKFQNTFLSGPNLISLAQIDRIFELEYLPEDKSLFKGYPHIYQKIIYDCLSSEGDWDVPRLEALAQNKVEQGYSHYFYIENFNILPLVAFIYLKKKEYYNVVRIIENLRYNQSW
jgi:vacuolar-type H+-ATPase subunit C/Vma6